MRILMVISEMDRGGAETHLLELSRALANRGHEITVASAGGRLVPRLTAAGIRHVTLPWNTHRPLSLWRARGRLHRLLLRDRFDLIHAHARLPAYLAAGAAKRWGIPLVTTVHARFRSGPVLRRLSKWGQKTIAVSSDLARYAEKEYRLSSEQITVIPNGIDTEVFRPTTQKTDKLRVLFFSRLDEDCSRGAFLLCALAERLQNRFPTLEICIAGGGSMLGRIRREVRALHCRNPTVRVRVMGHLAHMERQLPRAQAVVGVSRCALEAMACGVPVVLGGDEGFLGIAEGAVLLRGAESNFCCRDGEPMTAEALFSSLCEVLSRSRKERTALGQALRSYVQCNHSVEGMAYATEAVYERALAEVDKKGRNGLLLCGYYGYGNMGDEALLRAALRRVGEEFPNCSVAVLTRRGKKDAPAVGVPCVRRSSFLVIRRVMARSSILIFGGGTLLQDHTSLRSLFYYAVLLRMGHRMGLRVLLWGNGLEPPRTAIGARVLRWALEGCNMLGLRDEPSVRVAKELLGKKTRPLIRREQDLVLAYPPGGEDCRTSARERLGLTDDTAYAVIAPRGRGGRGVERLFCEWIATLRGEGLILVVVPMFPKEDGALCRQICTAAEGILAEALTPRELIELMRDSRIVCGMRLHSLIFASEAGAPFVGFGTDSKIEAFCRERGGVYFTDLYKKARR